ncbi:MAG: sulfite exporter TauE/SafE family protein [Alishewanella sp.]|nr:sulfite exporter TauE/SafE family protein [Alishewanella sp.]MDP5035410.1 sulfite exporter TauE/SafE family protein [Alishewanella sp.]
MNIDYVAALLIGFLGSSHCLVMCGGIVAALQFAMPAQSAWQKFRLQLLLSLGRLITYACFGGLVGYFGATAMGITGATFIGLRLLAGLLLLAMALYIARLWFGLTRLERAGQGLWRFIQPYTKRLLPLDSSVKALSYGMLWGFLPCGLVYSTLSWSLASGSASSGALIMLLFGVGTLPALLVFGSAANSLVKLKNQLWFRYSAALLLAVYGFYTIWLALHRLVF